MERRATLRNIQRTDSTHAGLWLDRYLQKTHDKEEEAAAKARHLRELVALPVPAGYREAYDRREAGLRGAGALCAPARVTGRLVIGLGQKGPVEAGIALCHTWGVPVLPGSAIKGLCAASAQELYLDPGWHKAAQGTKAGKSFAQLFGTTDDSGAVLFHDAWWDPRGAQAIPLALDVMTVHHPKYYRGEDVPPADWDSPTPVPFLSAYGTYLVAVEGDKDCCDAALQILAAGLRELGLGAKTNAGYGRLDLGYVSQAEAAAQLEAAVAARQAAEARRQEELRGQIQQVVARLNAGTAASVVPQKLAELSGEARREFARCAIEKLTDKWLKDKDRRDKPWVLELRAAK